MNVSQCVRKGRAEMHTIPAYRNATGIVNVSIKLLWNITAFYLRISFFPVTWRVCMRPWDQLVVHMAHGTRSATERVQHDWKNSGFLTGYIVRWYGRALNELDKWDRSPNLFMICFHLCIQNGKNSARRRMEYCALVTSTYSHPRQAKWCWMTCTIIMLAWRSSNLSLVRFVNEQSRKADEVPDLQQTIEKNPNWTS